MGSLKYEIGNMKDEIARLRKDNEYLQKTLNENLQKVYSLQLERDNYHAMLRGIRDSVANLCQVLADNKVSLPFTVTADLVRWCEIRLTKEV